MNSNDASIYCNRAGAYRGLGDAEAELGEDPRSNYSRAIEDYDQAIERNPNYAVAYGNRGAVYQSLMDFASAERDWNRAIELNPSFKQLLQPLIEKCRQASPEDF
jgi:tetratricopeptide (TPR) repeat protein